MKTKKLSIISVCFNVVHEIEDTVESILPFLNEDTEYVIIDGGSTDGTVQLLNNYKEQITLISEPDRGIYDAMNKGMAHCRGQWCIFINAGDRFLSIPHEIWDQNSNQYAFIACPVNISGNQCIYPTFDWKMKIHNTLPHQGVFYNMDYADLKYDLKYKVFSDYNLNLKKYLNGQNILILQNKAVAFHAMDGISNSKKYASEIFKVVKSNAGVFWMIISFCYFKIDGIKRRLGIR